MDILTVPKMKKIGISIYSKNYDLNPSIIIWLWNKIFTFEYNGFIISPYEYIWEHKGIRRIGLLQKIITFVINFNKDDSNIFFHYGIKDKQILDTIYKTSHIKSINKKWILPWSTKKIQYFVLTNIDGTFFKLIEHDKEILKFPGHEYIIFYFKDPTTNNTITMKVKRCKRIYTRGTGLMSILKYFTKPILEDCILLFSTDYFLKNNDLWTENNESLYSLILMQNETVEHACNRYCDKYKFTFIGFDISNNGNIVKTEPLQH